MFALIRMARIPCLVAFCCSAAFANMHPTSRSASAVEPNLFSATSWMPDALPPSGHFARSQLALLTPDILPPNFLPHRALPSAEPFGLPATLVPTGEISAKWRELQSRIFCRREDDRGLPLKRKHVLARRAPLFVDRKTWPKTRGARQAGMAQSSGQHDYQASKRLGSIW